MTEAKFEKAVAIIQALPKNGPIQPSTDERLYVSELYEGVEQV